APSARCSWDRRRRLKTKCFLRRGVCPQGALAAVAIIPGAPASPGGRLILVGSARSPSRLARAGGVYRGRPPFGDRRSARGCSGAVPERHVPKRPTRQCRGKSLYKTQPACIQVRETVYAPLTSPSTLRGCRWTNESRILTEGPEHAARARFTASSRCCSFTIGTCAGTSSGP